MSDALIELENVTKFFGYGAMGITRFPAVQEVSLSISGEKPEVLTLVGQSGSGKTTLAKLMLRILRPDEGVVKYRGRNLWKLNKSHRKKFITEVQPVFQDPMETFNSFENVDDYLYSVTRYLLKLDKSEALQKVSQSLEFVGLEFDKVHGKKPYEFSGGELQRVAIARAMLVNPKLLVADEPVSMLDASIRVNILNLFRKAKSEYGTSIVYITHDLSTASYIGEKLAVMYRGVVVEKGSMESILNEPLHPYTKVLLNSLLDYRKGKVLIRSQIQQSQFSALDVSEMLLSGCKYINHCPFRSQKCYDRPWLIEVSKDHHVACWLYTGHEHKESGS